MTSEGGARRAAPTLPATVHHAHQKPRSMSPRAGQCCALLPLTSVEPVSEDLGLSLEFLATLALQRVHRGEVARSGDRSGDRYFDCGRPVPSGLTRVFDELADGGLTALAEDSWWLRRVSLSEIGAARYARLSAPSRPVSLLQIPDPQFLTKIRARRRSSTLVSPPAPGYQQDPIPWVGAGDVEELWWARRHDDERLQLLTAARSGKGAVPTVSARVAVQATISLPVRSPGQHMHPLLCRPPVADRRGAGGRSR